MHTILNSFSSSKSLSSKMKSSNDQKALQAAKYLIEALEDALDYIPGELKKNDGKMELEASHLGTKFSITINFKKVLQLQPNFNAGIVQTECAKIRHFVEDLECYIQVAYSL